MEISMHRKNDELGTNRSKTDIIFIACLALAILICFTLVTEFTDLSALWCGILSAALFTAASAVFLLIRHKRHSKGEEDEDLAPALGTVMLDLITKINFPITLSDETGKLVWHNQSFKHLVGREGSLYGLNLDIFCSASLDNIIANDDLDDGLSVVVSDRFMKAKAYRIKTTEKVYYITVFQDNTKYIELKKQMKLEHGIVAYAVIDNLEELMQYIKEAYKTTANEIESILKDWVDSMGGIIKEYDRDKYLIFLESKDLDECIANKFAVLEKIRDIRVGESITPATVSMGIARIDGTLAEREAAAKAALDMALQRGGDQVVLKTGSGIEFFGGRTKTMQKRTKVRARVIANELCMHISKSENVLVMGHKYPDFDSFGACVGLAKLAMFCGVPVKIVINKKDRNLFECIEAMSDIEGYSDMFVDGSSALDMIGTNTLLVVADVNNLEIVESPEIARNVYRMAIIDHHRKTAEFESEPLMSYIEPSASSASELVAEILEQCLPQGTLTPMEANMMLMGMILDTKQFSRNTGTRTFGAAVYLRGEGANPADTQRFFKSELGDFIREATFESNVVIYRDSIAIALSENEGEAKDRIAAAKAADKLLSVKNVKASFALIRINDTVHVSARSSGTINVQLILEKLGGGGHFDIAGAQADGLSVKETLEKLKAAIDEYLDNL